MRKCLAILLTFTTIISCCIISCYEYKKDTVVTYEDAKQFADDVKELNSKNYDISNRLIVSSDKDIDTMGAIDKAVCADHTYILQYSSKESMQKAYEYYDSLQYIKYTEYDGMCSSICEAKENIDFKADCISTVSCNTDDAVKLMLKENVDFTNITIGIVDSGVAITPITENRFDGGHTAFPDWKENGTEDRRGHGTKVAGTIILNSPDNVRIRSYQVLNENGKGTYSDTYSQMLLAIAEGCRILNCSFVNHISTNLYKDIADYANEKNVIVVCAAGNDASDISLKKISPAGLENVITVGATSKFNELSMITNYGKTVDIYAPGLSLTTFDTNGDKIVYGWCGTSAAAPVVSAICALLITIDHELTYREIEDLLLLTGNATDDDSCTDSQRLVADAYKAVKHLLNAELEQCELDYTIKINDQTDFSNISLVSNQNATIYYSFLDNNIYIPFRTFSYTCERLYNDEILLDNPHQISACAYEPGKSKSKLTILSAPSFNNESDYQVSRATADNPYNSISYCSILDKTIIDIPSVIDGVEIQEIGSMCFAGNPTVETIILPESVKIIGAYAFANCPNLKTVIAPGVTECKHAAFYASDKLENVSIPNLSTANTALFKNCSALRKLQCKPLTQICNQAFYGCTSLESLEVDDNDLSFCTNTFNGCDSLTLSVKESSYMHRFAADNNIPFTLTNGLSVNECGHTNTEIIKDVKKDCYHNGYTAYLCRDCNSVYTLFDYCTGHEYRTETIMPTCTEYKQIKNQCKNCPYSYNERIGNYLVPHDTYTVVYLDATVSKTGRAYTYCKNCDTKLPDTIIPSLAPYTVKGTAVIAEDRNFTSKNNYPLSNVSITINGELVAVTDKNGEFNINLNSGDYTAYLTHPSGFDKVIEFTVDNRSVTIEKPIPLIVCDWHKDGIINAKDYAKLKNTDTVYGYDVNGDYLINDIEYKIFENCITY